jgi:hypothetical protein
MPRGGSKPGERCGGRAKGTPNKRSLSAIKGQQLVDLRKNTGGRKTLKAQTVEIWIA